MQTYTPISRFRPTLLAIIANCAGLAAALPAAAQVAGDECSNAIVVTANTPVSVDTATMTASASPPSSIIGPCGFMNWGATTKDAWFRFDAPADGRLTALLCGSNYDTSVVMYQGSCGSLFRIACDDDDCQPSGPTYQSKIMDQVVTAGPVYIRVGGYETAIGTAVLDVQFERTVGDLRCWGYNVQGQCNTPADLGPCYAIAGGGGTPSHSKSMAASGAGDTTSKASATRPRISGRAQGSRVVDTTRSHSEAMAASGAGDSTPTASATRPRISERAQASRGGTSTPSHSESMAASGAGEATPPASATRPPISERAQASRGGTVTPSHSESMAASGAGEKPSTASATRPRISVRAQASRPAVYTPSLSPALTAIPTA